jgi:hypothetical protein
MRITPPFVTVPVFVLVTIVTISLAACGGSGGSAGSRGASAEGTYTSVNDDALTFEFRSGGVVTLSAKAMRASSTGSYAIDGDKIVVTIDGQPHTFVRDGQCIEESRGMFGKLCLGGTSGETSNVSTRKPPVTEGTWVATNADGEFRIEFKPGNRLTLATTMAGGGRTSTEDGTFDVEGDRVQVRLPQGTPLTLQFVNDSYESTSFGLPMKFGRK